MSRWYILTCNWLIYKINGKKENGYLSYNDEKLLSGIMLTGGWLEFFSGDAYLIFLTKISSIYSIYCVPSAFQVYAMCFPCLICTSHYYYYYYHSHYIKGGNEAQISGMPKVPSLILRSLNFPLHSLSKDD